jgi:hypothetical protein
MAMTYRGAVIDLLYILDEEGGYRPPRHQVKIAQARTLVEVLPLQVITTVVCNMPLCASRLELPGDLSAQQASAKAEEMRWWTDGTKHVCVTCCQRGASYGA